MGIHPATEPTLDAEVIEGCRRGDSAAQRRLFERYADKVHSVALHFLRGDATAAKDVSQEVFVKVFRAIRTFRRDARLSTWLYRIVANACTDHLRRHRRLVLFGDLPPAIHPIAPAPEITDAETDVTAAVAKLSPKLRMVVLLRYFEDLSYNEIADALDLTAGTVASRLNRAHAVLARELAHRRPGVAEEGAAG